MNSVKEEEDDQKGPIMQAAICLTQLGIRGTTVCTTLGSLGEDQDQVEKDNAGKMHSELSVSYRTNQDGISRQSRCQKPANCDIVFPPFSFVCSFPISSLLSICNFTTMILVMEIYCILSSAVPLCLASSSYFRCISNCGGRTSPGLENGVLTQMPPGHIERMLSSR